MKIKKNNKFRAVFVAGILMYSSLLFFKYIPMIIWGFDILSDMSGHITTTVFILYILYQFIEQRKNLIISFYIFSIVSLILMGLQRIYSNAHNLTGIFLGLLLSLISVFIAQKYYLKNKNLKTNNN